MTLILAIDQSTSATKAVLFDAVGGIVDRASREHRQIYPQPGWVEHDAEEIWQNVLAVIREVAERRRSCWHDVVGLSFTNPPETFVLQRGNPTAKGDRVEPGELDFVRSQVGEGYGRPTDAGTRAAAAHQRVRRRRPVLARP